MTRALDDLTEAEWQLLMILRDPKERADRVKITIIIDEGNQVVDDNVVAIRHPRYAVRLENMMVERSMDGQGDSFSVAWEMVGMEPPEA
jgi:hypothetical protein